MHINTSKWSEASRALVVIARAGDPILELVPHKREKKKRVPGGYEKEIVMADDFDETPAEIVKAFYGELDE
ncbi:MAG: type II toxin-antitoxin system prevent-host-death family antitoxin [Proteobacteria bacterium]|nr:type II toxin-antitoxin system prevent-host-death family antitoxin [Pseudomonadota bacterium]